MRRHILVSYDIVDDAKRERLAKLLVGHLRRVQKSVFEGEVDDRQYDGLKTHVARIIDLEHDSVRFYQLCSRCLPAIDIVGTGVFIEEHDVDVLI